MRLLLWPAVLRAAPSDSLSAFEEVLGMPVEAVSFRDAGSVVLEAAIILGLLAVLWRYRPLRRSYQALPALYRRAVLVFLGLFFIGQFAGTLAFPFVKWNMYGKVHNEDPVYYQYTGVPADEAAPDSVAFEPGRALRALSPARIRVKMTRQIDAARATSVPAERARWQQQHQATLMALGRLYNEKHPAAPLEAIVTTRCVAVLRDGQPPAPRCAPLWTVPLAPGAVP